MQSSESEKDTKKKLKALKIMADVFVFIILEFIEPTLKGSLSSDCLSFSEILAYDGPPFEGHVVVDEVG